MIGRRIDGGHVLTGPRGSELTLLAVELALRGREPGRPVPDLAELAALHAEVCPDLAARLPQVAALLRSRPRPSAQADLAGGHPGAAGLVRRRVDVCDVAQVAERLGVTRSGTRWLLARGRLRGIKSAATGRWKIDLASVDAYAARRAVRRANALTRATRAAVAIPGHVPAAEPQRAVDVHR